MFNRKCMFIVTFSQLTRGVRYASIDVYARNATEAIRMAITKYQKTFMQDGGGEAYFPGLTILSVEEK